MQIRSKQDALEKIQTLKDIATKRPAIYEGLQGILQMKFDPVGCNPLSATSLNWIEQINQTATYLVSFLGVKWLYENVENLPSNTVFDLNLGANNGFDIQCEAAGIYCEVFAAVTGANNGKLKKDIKRLHHAEHGSIQKLKIPLGSKKFVFCMTADDRIKLPTFSAQKLLGDTHEKLDVALVRFSRRSNFTVLSSTQ